MKPQRYGEIIKRDELVTGSEMSAAIQRVSAPGYEQPKDDHWIDEEDRLHISPAGLRRRADAEALVRHGNDPRARFKEWGFPFDRKEQDFIFNHDFKDALHRAITELCQEQWIYLWGAPGLGKTSFAARVLWEILKDKPAEKASFISASKFIREKLRREKMIEAALRQGQTPDPDTGGTPLRKFVLLDEFDKWNLKNEFNAEVMRDLIDRLKATEAVVIITAQHGLDTLEKRAKNSEALSVIDRVRGKSAAWSEFKGRSRR